MVVQTWGFVKTRPDYPWTKVELRAEPGAVFRVSGATYSDALACLARVRSALQSMDVSWPGKALTLHVHPHCSTEAMMHLDVAVAVGLLAIQGKISQPKRLQRHLMALAEGHAYWREASVVMESDVQEAYDVMWMPRPGWRQL